MNMKIRIVVFVHRLHIWINLSSLRSLSNVPPARIKVNFRNLFSWQSCNYFSFWTLQLIHHALKCHLECLFERLLINGNARIAKHAVNVGRRKITRCYTAFSATEAFTFTVWAWEMFQRVSWAQYLYVDKRNLLFYSFRPISLRQLQHLFWMRSKESRGTFQSIAVTATTSRPGDDRWVESRVYNQSADKYSRTYGKFVSALLPKIKRKDDRRVKLRNKDFEV